MPDFDPLEHTRPEPADQLGRARSFYESVARRRTVREFAEGEIAPHVMHFDESQEFPRDIVRKAGARQLGRRAERVPTPPGPPDGRAPC